MWDVRFVVWDKRFVVWDVVWDVLIFGAFFVVLHVRCAVLDENHVVRDVCRMCWTSGLGCAMRHRATMPHPVVEMGSHAMQSELSESACRVTVDQTCQRHLLTGASSS